jgi:hypothetical protein
MSRRAVIFMLGLLLICLAGQTRADTLRVPDPVDSIGLHDILTLVVDDTGPTVGATVVHRGASSAGSVRLDLFRDELAQLRACDGATCRAPMPPGLSSGPAGAASETAPR